MPKKISRKGLVKKLDNVFSKWIRNRDSKDGINGNCVTCGKPDLLKKLQAGHFISRKDYSTRWDEENVHTQCLGCNMFRGGEQFKMSIYVDNKYGKGKSDELLQKSRQIVKFTNSDLEDMINKFKEV